MRATLDILKSAASAKSAVASAGEEKINEALLAMADSLIKNTDKILLANRVDEERAIESGKI